MLSALIKYGKNSLTTQFPVEAMRLYNQLGSIGINTPANEIPALGNADISVKLFAGELLFNKRAVGQSLINQLTANDTLHDVNVASYWLKVACEKDHEAFVELVSQNPTASLAELRDLAKEFQERPLSSPVDDYAYDENQDMDDEMEP